MDLQYPIGKFTWGRAGEGLLAGEAERRQWLADIEQTPARLRAAVAELTEGQLDTPYRPGGWTVRQLVHHLADSHMNSYVRFRLALTEDEPTIKPYEQQLWADLPDARSAPAELSLTLLDSLHQRWVSLLRSLAPEDFARAFKHPELGRVTLERNLALYAWHGKHHVAHITNLRERSGWKPAGA
ncbi:MAG: YfiT family bacillithiol transferase [Terriglobia bacterium]